MVTLREALGNQLDKGSSTGEPFPVYVLNQPPFNTTDAVPEVLRIYSTDIGLYVWDSIEELPGSNIPRVTNLRLK
jgi:hypothetical protein